MKGCCGCSHLHTEYWRKYRVRKGKDLEAERTHGQTKAKRNARHKVAGPNEIHKRRPSEDHVVVPIAGEVLDSRAGAEPLSCWHGREPCAVAQDVLPCCPGAVGRGAVSV